MRLTLRVRPGHVVIEVSDDDPSPPALTWAGPESESGRGLMLVQAFSKEWGYEPRPGGKVVFAVLTAAEWRAAPGWHDNPSPPSSPPSHETDPR